MAAKKRQTASSSKSKADGGVNAKRTTRKASRSPPPVTVKKEDRAARGVEANEREAAPTGPPVRDEEQEVRQDMTNLHVNEDSGGSGRGSRPGGGGWPFPVMYGGPVPRSIQDVDRPERLQERRYCGRLFDGTVEYGVDRDGLRECLLIEFPDLLPLDRDRLRKWKAANKNAIERGDEPLLLDDFDFDDDMTDEERTRVVECCTPADLEGLQAGEIIVYEDDFVEYRLGGVRFNVTEGTDVLDRQDVYWANMNEQSTDQAGNECNICVYPMFTVKHRVIISPMIDELI